MPLESGHGGEVRHLVGDPFNPLLAGPSSAYWGRAPGDQGRVFYMTTDGGRTAPPPDGPVRRGRAAARGAGDGGRGRERVTRRGQLVAAGRVAIHGSPR